MSIREAVYLDDAGFVVNVVVVGGDDPSSLLASYGYSEWVDRSDADGASIGWQRVNGEWRPPQPFPSWVWGDGRWAAPVPMPSKSGVSWDEDAQEWIPPAPDPRASAIAKLQALGLSPEEAAAIAGSV